MPRKNRVTSVTEAVKAAQADQISPPSNVPLSKADMPFFASVIAEFARSEWTAHQLECAAFLAKKMRLLRDELETLESEGAVLVSGGGSPCQNPRVGVVRMYDTSILASRRSLALHARASTGDNRSEAARKRGAKANELDDIDDDLLARPN